MTTQANNNNNSAAQQTTQVTTTEVKGGRAVSSDDLQISDLDDLIPVNLREAVDKAEKVVKPAQQTQKQKTTQKIESRVEPLKESKKAKVVEEIVKEDEEVEDTEETDEEDDGLDLSPENIDKLLEGDKTAVDKKEATEEKPSWHEDPAYKEFLKQTKFSNSLSGEKLDKIILDAVDKKILKESEERKTLDVELEQLKTKDQLNTAEIQRLKNIERTAYFDTMPETGEKYVKPMQVIGTNIKSLLDLEGTQITAQQIVNTKNRAEFTELIKDVDFDDATLTQLTNYWRSYKDLQFKYGEDRKSAQTELKKHLSFNISDESAGKILKTSLIDFINADEKYSYIKTAVQEGFDKHEHVSKILGTAKQNFMNIIRAISNPVDYSKNVEWLDGVAKYTLDAAHSAHMEDQYSEVSKENKVLTENLVKVVRAYKKLLGSAKTKSPTKGSLIVDRANSNGRSDEDTDLKEFKALLANQIGVDDILPSS